MQSIWFKKHNFSTIQKNSQYIKSWDMYELKLQYIKEFFVFNTIPHGSVNKPVWGFPEWLVLGVA